MQETIKGNEINNRLISENNSIKKIYVVEAIGELIGCSKSIKKCYMALKKVQPEIASYAGVCRAIREDEHYGYFNSSDDLLSIKKTTLL